MRKIFIGILLAVVLAASACVFAACDDTVVTPPDPSAPINYTVTIDGGSGSGTYPSGAPCTAIADVPDENVFVGWYMGETLVSADSTYKFKVESDVALKAVVRLEFVSVTVTGGGTLGAAADTSAKVKIGESVTVTADSNQNRQFKYFIANGDAVNKITANPYTFTVNEDTKIEAFYDRVCLISVVDGYVVGETDKFSVGDQCTVKADEPGSGMYFNYWYTLDANKNETVLSRETEFTFEVTDTVVIYAKNLSKIKLTVEGGVIDGTTENVGYYFPDDSVTVVAEDAPAGKFFSHWQVDGRFAGKEKKLTFQIGDADMECAPVFVDTQLAAATNENHAIFNWWGTNGTSAAGFEFLRYKPQGTNDIFNTNGLDYIVYYIYTATDADKYDYVGAFKVYSQINGGTDKLVSMDGEKNISYLGGNNNDRVVMGGDVALLHDFIEYCIEKDYTDTTDYYFGIKLISKYDSGIADSEISVINDVAYNRNGQKVRGE